MKRFFPLTMSLALALLGFSCSSPDAVSVADANKNMEQAVELNNKAVESNPSDAYAYEKRAKAKSRIGGDLGGANADFGKAIELSLDSMEACLKRAIQERHTGDLREAKADFDKAAELSAEAYFNRSINKDNQGDLEGAIRDIYIGVKLCRLLPPKKNVTWIIGQEYFILGGLEKKRGDIQGEQYDYSTGQTWLQTDLPKNMKNMITPLTDPITEITSADENSLWEGSFDNLATSMEADGDLEGAIAEFNMAIDVKPDLASAYYKRGLVKQAKHDWKGVIADFGKYIEFQPDNWAVYNSRGDAKKNIGDLDGAIADYTKAIQLKPDLAVAYSNRGDARKVIGDVDGANADYIRANEIKAGPSR